MTPQIFLDILRHALFLLEWVNLLVIDEVHHTNKSHPYSLLFEEFYWSLEKEKRPKVFCMSAVPAADLKVGDTEAIIRQKILALEKLVDAKVGFWVIYLKNSCTQLSVTLT